MDPVEPSPEFPQEKGDPVSKDPIANIRKLLKRERSAEKKPKPKTPKSGTTRSGVGIWRLAALISFVINIFFVVLILWIGSRLFKFQTAVAEPLLEGVYNAVGQMDDVQVQTEVQVSSDIPVSLA